MTTTLTLSTDVATASLDVPAAPEHHRSAQAVPTALAVTVLIGLGGLALARRKLSRLLCAIALMTGLGMAISSCGGGGSNNGGCGSTTPIGSNTITMTATAGSLVQTANFTLTVQ